VLDGAEVPEAQCFGFFRDRQRFRVIIGGALVGVVDGGKKLHTELHVAPCSVSRSRESSVWMFGPR
jgi:hypothetical protein